MTENLLLPMLNEHFQDYILHEEKIQKENRMLKKKIQSLEKELKDKNHLDASLLSLSSDKKHTNEATQIASLIKVNPNKIHLVQTFFLFNV